MFDPATVDLSALFRDPDSRRDTVLAAFADLDPSGARGEERWNGYRDKLTGWAAARPTVEAPLADWDRHRAALDALLVGPGTIGAGLVAAGAVAHSHLMRNRFTAVDLLDLLGRWTEKGP
jgi:glycerol-1-phosphate dehydrogenase [NAD(P)+]